jgi:Fe2+ transport system protein FeoA
MADIRPIGVNIFQEFDEAAAAPAASELKQVLIGVNKQVVPMTAGGTYANDAVDIPLVDLLATSELEADSVKVWVFNEFGLFEIPKDDTGITSDDLSSYTVNGVNAGTVFPEYLRVERKSTPISVTGAIVEAGGPTFTLQDPNATFLNRRTRPIDDALAAGSKLYPQVGDTLVDPSTFLGLYAYVQLRPVDGVAPYTRFRIIGWNSETELQLDPLGPPVPAAATNVRYEIITEEPAAGRIPGATAEVRQSYTALRKDDLGKVITVFGAADALAKAGSAVDANPLGLAALKVALINPAQEFYIVRVASDDAVGHALAAEKVALSDAYYMCPITAKKEVNDIYVTQATQLSLPEGRKERRAFIHQEFDDRLLVRDLGDGVAVDVTGAPSIVILTAQFLSWGTVPGQFVELKDTGLPGDPLRQFLITHVVSETEVEVSTLDPGGLGALVIGSMDAVKIVSAPYDAAQLKDVVKNAAEGYANRRVNFFQPEELRVTEAQVVVADTAVGGESVWVSGKYWGSIIAAMYAADEPGQPISTKQVPQVLAVRGSWDVWNEPQQRELTSSGVFLMVQKNESTLPFIRHQVTTDTSSKQKQESSFGDVVDSLALGLRETITDLFGANVINKQFLDLLRVRVDSFFRFHKDHTQRISDFDITAIGQSTIPGLEDTVAIRVLLDVPNVANNADVTFIL